MSEKRPSIKQGGKTYRFTCTEETVIGGVIWTRDRYDNENGKPNSYLLVNFVDTGKPAPKPEETPKRLNKKLGLNIRQYVQDWKAKEKV